MAGGVGPLSPFMASDEGPSLLFISGGVGPHSPLVCGGVGPSSPFVPGGVGPSSSFGLGPSFTVCGAGGSSSCVDGAAGGSSLALSCIVSVCCRHVSSSSHVLSIACPRRRCVSSPCHCLMPSSYCCRCRALFVTCRLVARCGTCVRNIGRGR